MVSVIRRHRQQGNFCQFHATYIKPSGLPLTKKSYPFLRFSNFIRLDSGRCTSVRYFSSLRRMEIQIMVLLLVQYFKQRRFQRLDFAASMVDELRE